MPVNVINVDLYHEPRVAAGFPKHYCCPRRRC